jgi:hypothetical protein
MVFENESLGIRISYGGGRGDPPYFRIRGMELKKEFEGTFSLIEAAEMAVVLSGVVNSLPFLPL